MSDEDWAALHQLGSWGKDEERQKILQTTQVGAENFGKSIHKLSFNDKAWKEGGYPVVSSACRFGRLSTALAEEEFSAFRRRALGEDPITAFAGL